MHCHASDHAASVQHMLLLARHWLIMSDSRITAIYVWWGNKVIKKHLQDGVDIRRIGLVAGGAPPRQHAEILSDNGEKVRFDYYALLAA